jgi:hypothetical protein
MQTLSNAKMVDGVISFADSCFLANGTLSYKWIAGFNYVDLLGQEIIGDKASLQVYDANYFYSLPQPQQAPVLNQQFEIKESNICNAGWLALDDVYYLYCVTMETHGNCADIAVFSFDADSKLRIVAEATLWATYVWEIDNIKGLGPAFIYFRCWSLGPDQSEGVVEINPFTLDEGFNTYYNINLGDLLTEEEIAKLGSLDDYERIISYALTIRDDWRQFLIAGHDNRTGYGTNANGSTYPIRFSGAPMWQEHDIQ